MPINIFNLKRSKNNRFYFTEVKNGHVIDTSQMYTRKAGAIKTMTGQVKATGPMAQLVVDTSNKRGGEVKFNLWPDGKKVILPK